VLRRIFGLKRDDVTGEWREDYITRSYMLFTHQIFEWSNKEDGERQGM
jgi:hypothetical protein